MKLSNKNGFSLVELMVTVSLIGILAAIGIPSYSKFRVKAYQSEAKTQLANLYVAQKSFYLQYNSYYPSLSMIGYAPSGNVRYNIGFGGYDTSVTTEPAIAPTVQTNTKVICTGVGGTGTDSRCNMIVFAPNIDSSSIVRQHSYIAGAVSYEESLAQRQTPSTLIQVAEYIVLGVESYAHTYAEFMADPCVNRYDQWLDGWGIDQNKTISSKKIPPAGGYFQGTSCDNIVGPLPAE